MSLKTFSRLLSTSLVLISLVQHEIAFAANVSAKLPSARLQQRAAAAAKRLQTPEDLASATALVNLAKTRELKTYFAQGGTHSEVSDLHSDLSAVIFANARIGFIDNRSEFEEWFKKNETAILMAAQKAEGVTLQKIVTESYLAYMVTIAEEKSDLPGVLLKLQDLIQHPATIATGSLAAAYGTFAFVRDLVKGAVVAGPGAGIVGALVEPIVRPIRERAAVIGNRLLGDRGARLAERLNSERESLIETRSQIEARERARQATVRLMARRGLEMTPAQANENMERLKSSWNDAKQIWESTHTGGYRDGRAYTSDNLILRPHALVTTLISSVVGREVFRQGIESTLDRMLAQTSDRARMNEVAERFMQEVKAAAHANATAPTSSYVKKIKASRAELLELGATEYQLNRISENLGSEMALYKQAAVTLASASLYELMYPEFNRELAPETAKAYDLFKSHYCFDYFEAEFRTESVKILNQLGLDLKAAKAKVETDLGKVESEIKVLEEKSAKPKKSASDTTVAREARIETRTHRPILIPARKVAVKPALAKPAPLKPAVEATKPSAAVEAAKAFVASDANRAAAAGAEDLKPGKRKSWADRAKEAAAKAAKK